MQRGHTPAASKRPCGMSDSLDPRESCPEDNTLGLQVTRKALGMGGWSVYAPRSSEIGSGDC